ncbi:hypothetical protein BRADI_1g26370v3 [Brachypodium distachyon]|uniref:S-acyltransferase n=1 Tax=Brachypodium distachyon TaxID=15368 RepID=A0A0Q3RSK1_BRADI|nr:hypothetical protein BRADI_1g26370v3 [Brachypodium distachyon]
MNSHQRSTEQPDDDSFSSAMCDLKSSVTKNWRFLIPSCFSGASPSALPLSSPPPTTVHQVWPGRNVFFLDGRVICGPDPRGLILSAISVLLAEWIFLAYVVDPSSKHPILIAVFSMALAATVLVTLLLTATRDPGIIPRNQTSASQEPGTSNLRRTRSQRIVVDGVEMKQKYCRVCKMFRAPRSSHCAVCDNCVDKFDHHCPWIGQCIGLTSHERHKERYRSSSNPYDRGAVGNIKECLFQKLPPPRVNFRAVAESGTN